MIKNIDDTMLMSYVLKTGNRGHNLDELALDYLSHSTIKFADVTNVNKKKISFQDVDIKLALNYAAEDSDVTYRLWEILKIELIKNKLYDFYFFVEKPLVEIIAVMEINGCKIVCLKNGTRKRSAGRSACVILVISGSCKVVCCLS